MKKFIVLFMMVLAMMSCADSKTFERADGTKFVAEPYGWANYQSNKIEGVTYEACFENIVWDIVAIETVIVPVWLTGWCGMDDTFRAMAENDYELDEIANQLAYENFQFYDCENDIAEEFGYDPDDMEDEDWDKLWEQTSEGDYYHYTIEEFEGDDEEWEEYDGEIYGKGE